MSEKLSSGAGVSTQEFQSILRERKSEKKANAEKKRRDDLKTIEEINSKDGKEPVEIFPKEIWQMILDEMDPDDKGSMCKLHSLFGVLTEKHRIRDMLLPLFLPVQFNVPWKKLVEREGLNSRYPYVSPDILRHLRLREVSKTSSKRIERMLDDELQEFLNGWKGVWNNELTISLKLPMGIFEKTRFDALVENLLSGKAFLCRSISINLFWFATSSNSRSREQLFPPFKDKVTEFLERWGWRMWYFRFIVPRLDHLEHDGLNITELYGIIRDWLVLMPNLRCIDLDFQSECKDRSSRTRLNSLASYMEVFPPPDLKYLKRVDFKVPEKRDDLLRICDAILAINTEVTYFRFNGNLGMPELRRVCFPRVRDLPLTSITLRVKADMEFRDRTSCGVTISQVKSALNPKWKLKQLKMSIDAEDEHISSTFEILLQYPSLQTIDLEIQNVRISPTEIPFLRLPNLEIFHLNMMNQPKINSSASKNITFFYSLQFLLYAKNLKEIHWGRCFATFVKRIIQGHLKAHHDPTKIISFGGGWNHICQSNNIWQVFPYLKSIHVYNNAEAMDSRYHWIYQRNMEGKIRQPVHSSNLLY